MPSYRFRVAWREKNGVVRKPVHDEAVTATSLREAIGEVLGNDAFLAEGTNFAWLSDEAENLVWTLRMDDHNAEST